MPNDLTVAYILTTDSGGLPHYTAELANAVSEHATVHVLKPRETTADDVFSSEVVSHEVFHSSQLSIVNILRGEFSPMNVIKSFYSYKNLNVIEEIEPDIVHFTDNLFPPAKGFTWFHGIDEEYPLNLTYHEIVDYGKSYPNMKVAAAIFAKYALNWLLPSLDVEEYIVHTENNRDQLVANGVDQSKVDIIPHGTYTMFNEYSAENTHQEENTLLYFGRIVPSKALSPLIKSIPIVQERIPDVKLIVAGDGEIPKDARQILEEHPENFEIHNEFVPNEEVHDLFERSQLVTVPHREESGHSGTLTIAFSFGKPVVTSNVGEFPRLVEESGSGITVPPEAPRSYADAIATILRDDKKRSNFAEQSKKMGDKHSWENVAERHMEVYTEQVNK